MEVIAIDFGTTQSSIAYLTVGKEEMPKLHLFPEAVGLKNDVVPTCLIEKDGGKDVFGWAALKENDQETLKTNFKREIKSKEGKALCRKFIKYLAGCVRKNYNVDFLSQGKFMTAIGVPVGWDEKARAELKGCCIEAGLPGPIWLVLEPEAALHAMRLKDIANEFNQDTDKSKLLDLSNSRFLIFDFGGGTLDLCLVQMMRWTSQVIAKGGNDHLGGIDFDKMIRDDILCKMTREDVSGVRKAKLESDEEIHKIKLILSKNFYLGNNKAIAPVQIPGMEEYGMSRVEFWNLCRDHGIVDRIKRAIEDLLKNSPYESDQKGENIQVVLTGGSSQWWFLDSAPIEEQKPLLSENSYKSKSPEMDVAIGIAVKFAWPIGGQPKNIYVKHRFGEDEFSELELVRAGAHPPYKVHLGSFTRTRLFKKGLIELKFWEGDKENVAVPMKSSVARARISFRSNWPWLGKIHAVKNVLRGEPVIRQLPDTYKVNFTYGEPSCEIEIKNNKGKTVSISATPGFESYFNWRGKEVQRKLTTEAEETRAGNSDSTEDVNETPAVIG